MWTCSVPKRVWITARKQMRFIFINAFSSNALEKRDRKHFLAYIKVKEKLFDINKCALENFLKL